MDVVRAHADVKNKWNVCCFLSIFLPERVRPTGLLHAGRGGQPLSASGLRLGLLAQEGSSGGAWVAHR